MTQKLKQMPYSEDAEKAVLACMLLDGKTINIAREKCSVESFYIERHRYVYLALINVYDQYKTVDYVPLINELSKMGRLEDVGKEYLVDLGDYITSSANIEGYIGILQDKFLARKLINACNETINLSYQESQNINDLLSKMSGKILDLNRVHDEGNIEHIHSILNRNVETLQRLYENKRDITGVRTGYEDLDKMTSGWQYSDLVIIAGRPSMGKTAFVLNLALHAARFFLEEKKRNEKGTADSNLIHKIQSVAFFSLEMGAEQLTNRLIAIEARIDGNKLRTGNLDQNDWIKLINAIARLADYPIYIDDSPGISLLELRSKARRLQVEFNVGMIVIDYLQLMEDKGSENRQQQISNISRNLKLLAKELKIPIIALSQLSRALESRNDKRPQLSDLRESGSIEQDADLVIFVHRPEYYKIQQFDDDGSSTENKSEIIIGKHRNGAIGDLRLEFIKQYGIFADISKVNYSDFPDKKNIDF